MTADPLPGPLPGGEVPVPPPRGSIWQRMHPVLFAVLSLLLVFVLYQGVAGGITILLSKGKITLDNVSFIRWATVISQVACILLPTLVLGRLRYGAARSVFPLRFPSARQTLLSVVGVFALQQLLQVYMMAQDAIPLPPELRHIEDLIKGMYEETYRMLVSAGSPGEFLVVVFTVALVPAISEEYLFRGLVQHSVEESSGGLRAAIATGIIFGAYHLNPINIVPLMALGAYFGYLVYRSRNLAVAISAHFFNNFVACAAAYMNVRDDFIALSPGGAGGGPVVMANALLFLVVFLGSTYYFVRTTDEEA